MAFHAMYVSVVNICILNQVTHGERHSLFPLGKISTKVTTSSWKVDEATEAGAIWTSKDSIMDFDVCYKCCRIGMVKLHML